MQRRIEESVKDRIERLSKTMTVGEMANLTNLSTCSITNIRAERNLQTKRPRISLVMSQERQKEIAVEYFVNGLTQKAVIAKYGLTKQQFYLIRRRNQKFYKKKKTGIVTERTERIKEMLLNGTSVVEIVARENCSRQYVYMVKRQLHI